MRREHRENNSLIKRIFIRFARWMRRVMGSHYQATTQSSTSSSESEVQILLNGASTDSASQAPASSVVLNQSSSQPQGSSSTGLFSLLADLPDDLVIHYLLPDLRLRVDILKNPLTEKQKSQVLTFDTYHLIIHDANSKKYRIGFCKKSFLSGKKEYVTLPLDRKSSLFRLITENPELINKDTTQNGLVIAFLEQEIKKAGGLRRPVAHTINRLTQLCRRFRNVVRGEGELSRTYNKVMMDEALDKLLHHVAYGEEKEAEEILKWSRGELLRSTYKGSVTDCSRVRTFLSTTAFQLAVRNRDWHMYQMMLKYIPQDQRLEFEADFRGQLQEVEERGLQYDLDNLGLCGLRVLETDPSEEQKVDVVKRNAYHLILQRDSMGNIQGCSIGFYDPKTKKYKRSAPLSETSALKQFALQLENSPLFRRKEGYPHLVIRDKALLELARKEIKALGGLTEEKKTTTLKKDLELLQGELKDYADKYNARTLAERTEAWCVLVGWAQRLLPANAWQWWMSPTTDWWDISENDFRRPRPRAPATHDGFGWFPLSPSLGSVGCRRPVGWGVWWRVGVGGPRFLEFFLSSSLRELSGLKQQLGVRDHAPSIVAGLS